jgi:hypothetical protein
MKIGVRCEKKGAGKGVLLVQGLFLVMAKNTSSSAFRKIDVDQYNEDNYREEEQGELQSAPVGPDEAEVTALMNQYPFHNCKVKIARM